MTHVLRPAEALARAVEILVAQGFSVVARNTRGDSVYLKPDACAFALRVSNHARTPKQRRNHPDAITSLVLRDPTSEPALAERVAVALRNFGGERAKRERTSIPSLDPSSPDAVSGGDGPDLQPSTGASVRK